MAEQTPHVRARPVAAPNVAWIGRHLGPCRCRPLRRLGGPKMHDANPRGCRQTTRGLGGAEWILDLAQMADHGDVEATRLPVMHTRRRRGRLMHDANLASKPCGHAPSRELLQRNEPIGACE